MDGRDNHGARWPERPGISELDLFVGYRSLRFGRAVSPETVTPPETAQEARDLLAAALTDGGAGDGLPPPCICRHALAWHGRDDRCTAEPDGIRCYCPGYLSRLDLAGRLR